MPDSTKEAKENMEKLLEGTDKSGEALDFNRFRVGKKVFKPDTISKELKGFLSENRKNRIEEVLKGRTFTVATVVEGLVNTGNVSAVMRTAEALGFQPFHIINNGGRFKNSERISHGAEKWLSTWQWANPPSCVSFLKNQGYQVVATTLNENAVPLDEIDFTTPTALVLGNEAGGVTDSLLQEADQTCYIPMSGFTRSLNISVAAAVCLSHAYEQRLREQGFHGDLSSEQKAYLRALFYYKSVNHRDRVIKKLEAE